MTDYELPPIKTTLIATGIAAIVAVIVLFLAVLPAEYGIDPTGMGDALGFKQLSDEPEEPELNVTVISTPIFAYNASWPTTTELLEEASGNLAEGESETITVSLITNNMTRLEAQLNWVDEEIAGQQSDPDAFEVTITDNYGTSYTWQGQNEGPAGSITASFFVQDVPNSVEIDALGDGHARTLYNHAYPGRSSHGEWQVEVKLVRAGGLAVIPDAGNSWGLKIFATTYELQLGNPVESTTKHNDFQITVPALSGVEYKVYMREGNSLDYSWHAPFDLYYDFHGVRSSGEEVSHEEATAAVRADHFIAPFEGKHGWYWQNDSTQDVTVQLTLRGDYTVFQ